MLPAACIQCYLCMMHFFAFERIVSGSSCEARPTIAQLLLNYTTVCVEFPCIILRQIPWSRTCKTLKLGWLNFYRERKLLEKRTWENLRNSHHSAAISIMTVILCYNQLSGENDVCT